MAPDITKFSRSRTSAFRFQVGEIFLPGRISRAAAGIRATAKHCATDSPSPQAAHETTTGTIRPDSARAIVIPTPTSR